MNVSLGGTRPFFKELAAWYLVLVMQPSGASLEPSKMPLTAAVSLHERCARHRLSTAKQLATQQERLTRLFAGQQLLNFERSLRRYLSPAFEMQNCWASAFLNWSADWELWGGAFDCVVNLPTRANRLSYKRIKSLPGLVFLSRRHFFMQIHRLFYGNLLIQDWNKIAPRLHSEMKDKTQESCKKMSSIECKQIFSKDSVTREICDAGDVIRVVTCLRWRLCNGFPQHPTKSAAVCVSADVDIFAREHAGGKLSGGSLRARHCSQRRRKSLGRDSLSTRDFIMLK